MIIMSKFLILINFDAVLILFKIFDAFNNNSLWN